MRLKDKVMLVTGGGSGIGRAIALVFAREGARVAVTGRRRGPLEETVSSVKSSGGKAVLIEGDVSVQSDAAKMVRKTIKTFGKMDILINNAGVDYKSGGTIETDEEGWDVTMQINLKGVFLVSRSAVPELEKTAGNIVNIGSTRGLVGYPKSIAYCASKGALVNLTRSMALDLAEKSVRVNCVCPGPVDTPMARKGITEDYGNWETGVKKVSEDNPLGRIGQPEDVAYACLYLASDEASWVTGAILPVDGGFLAK